MTAESLVAELEAMPAGESWADLSDKAEHAIDAERTTADDKIFPSSITPTSADAIAAYGAHIARLPVARYADELAQVHQRALATWPDLAALCRSPEALADVGEAAARHAAPANNRETHATAEARASSAAIEKYKLAIATQLAACDGHELADAARAYLAAVTLGARLAAAKARHEEHAREQLARAEAERRAAARVVADKTAERVRAAAAAAEDLRQRATIAANEYRRLRGASLAERIRASGIRELRVGTGDGEQLFDANEVAGHAAANQLSLETLERYEHALAQYEVAP